MKGPEAFRTISEAAAELGVPQHVLRFWETKFSFIRPMKRAGGRRFYRRQDLEVLRGVRTLLHDEGYTIKGVQRLHKEQGVRRVLAAASGSGAASTELAPAADTTSLGEGQASLVEAPVPLRTDTVLALSRPVLDTAARLRLGEILGDLESTKLRIDALLSSGPGALENS